MATNAEIDSLAARIRTAFDARAALIRAREFTVEGFRILTDLTALPVVAGTREQARSALELVDQRIDQVRGDLPELGSTELSEAESRRVAGTLLYARDTLRTIDGQTGSAFDDFLASLKAGFQEVLDALNDAAKAAGKSTWLIALPIILVIVGLLLLRRSA